MDGYDLWHTDEYDYLWYSEDLKQRTTLVIADCRYKVVLAAFIRENRKKLVEDGIWIFPAEPREMVPVRVMTAMRWARRSTDSDGESLVCQWGSYFEEYKSTAWWNPLAFANEHEDLAVEFLTALVEEMEACSDAAHYAEDMEAYRRRIAEIEAKADYVPWDSSEDFWNFHKTEVVAVKEVTESVDEEPATKKKTTQKKNKPKQKPLPLSRVYEKVRRHFPLDIDKDDPCLIPSAGGEAFRRANIKKIKANEEAPRTLDTYRSEGETMPVGGDTLGMDKDGRVFFKPEMSILVFYYDLTLDTKSKSFRDFHNDVN